MEQHSIVSPYVGFEVIVLLNDHSVFEGQIIEDSLDGDTVIELQDGRIISGADCVFRLKEDIPSVGDLVTVFFGGIL